MLLESVRTPFRALAESVVPETSRLDESGWEELERTIEGALASKPVKLRRQLGLLIRAINWLSVLRFGRRLARLDPSRRTRFLSSIQDSRIRLLRVGFWGVRTLVFLGYYGGPEGAAAIGYGATPRGWEARR